MGVSLRIIQRIIVSVVFLWLGFLLPLLFQQDDDSTSLRWQNKEFHRIPSGRMSQFPHQQRHERHRSHRRGRELRHPNHDTNINNNNNNNNSKDNQTDTDSDSIGERNRMIGPWNGDTRVSLPNQLSNPRQRDLKTSSRRGHRRHSLPRDGERNDVEYNSSKRDVKLPLPIIVMGFPVSRILGKSHYIK
jgi:hypothetical protein